MVHFVSSSSLFPSTSLSSFSGYDIVQADHLCPLLRSLLFHVVTSHFDLFFCILSIRRVRVWVLVMRVLPSFPRPQLLANWILCIPAMSAARERSFSCSRVHQWGEVESPKSWHNGCVFIFGMFMRLQVSKLEKTSPLGGVVGRWVEHTSGLGRQSRSAHLQCVHFMISPDVIQ